LLQTEENVARKKLLVVLWCSYRQYYRKKANTINSGVRRKFSWWIHSVAYGGHFLFGAIFVTSQFDVIIMFPKQRFDEVC